MLFFGAAPRRSQWGQTLRGVRWITGDKCFFGGRHWPAKGPDAKLVRFSIDSPNGAPRPLGSQGHPKPTATLACPEGVSLEMG